MAKTYINTVKYLIKLKFEIDGIVDKPDIIGAIFGQSEGLLGDEMDLKELQKNGKLGRIEINHTTSMGRTKGEVIVPSSMDMAETSLLAAGIESVDKVGPCESKFEIIDVEDTRTDKRKEIKSRAQELLQKMMDKGSSDTQMLSDELRERVRASDIREYGPDKLPAGPGIEEENELIVVEGRADVINMLKNQIKNVIAMNGSNIPPTISQLSKTKEITVFVDGDRGGQLNARKLAQVADVRFIATAPDGKEVEELTRKEILHSLKKKIPAEDFGKEFSESKFGGEPKPFQRREPMEHQNTYKKPLEQENSYRRGPPSDSWRRDSRGPPRGRGPGFGRGPFRPRDSRGPREYIPDSAPRERPPIMEQMEFTPMENERPPERPRLERQVLTLEERTTFKPILDGMKGSMSAKLLDAKNEEIKEMKVKDVVAEIAKTKKKINAIIFDGVITKRLVDAAEKAGIKYVIGARKGKLEENKNVKAASL